MKLQDPVAPNDCTVHHICHFPATGVWTVIKTLALHQERENPGSANLIVVADKSWPHRDELEFLGLRFSIIEIPSLQHGLALPYLVATHAWRRINKLLGPSAIAHYHNAWMSGALIGNHSLQPAVVTVHGLPATEYIERSTVRATLHRYLARRTLRSGATMVSVDADAVERFSSLFHVPEVPFYVVPNGVLDTDSRGCPSLRGEKCFTVGFIGSLEERKGWQLVCNAVGTLAQSGKSVRLLIAGDGSVRDRDRARAYCAAIGNGSEYLGLTPQPVKTVVPSLDLLALPSSAEGVPMAVLECLSAGVPVVCTSVGGLGTLLTDNKDCIFVQRNSPAIAAAISRIKLSPDLHRKMSCNARSTFETRGSVYAATRLRWVQNRVPVIKQQASAGRLI